MSSKAQNTKIFVIFSSIFVASIFLSFDHIIIHMVLPDNMDSYFNMIYILKIINFSVIFLYITKILTCHQLLTWLFAILKSRLLQPFLTTSKKLVSSIWQKRKGCMVRVFSSKINVFSF